MRKSTNPRFQKSLPQPETVSALEKLRIARCVENETKLKEFQDFCDSISERKKQPRPRKTATIPEDLPLRTPSKRGLWSCLRGCSETFRGIDVFIGHLREYHDLPFRTECLAPLGLGLCPNCEGVFCSIRGISIHLKSCKHPRPKMCEGSFPKKCFVWWEGYRQWYEGLASPDKEDCYCWNVRYPKKLYGYDSRQRESVFLVTFVDPSTIKCSFVHGSQDVIVETPVKESLLPLSQTQTQPLKKSVPSSLSLCLADTSSSVLTACSFDLPSPSSPCSVASVESIHQGSLPSVDSRASTQVLTPVPVRFSSLPKISSKVVPKLIIEGAASKTMSTGSESDVKKDLTPKTVNEACLDLKHDSPRPPEIRDQPTTTPTPEHDCLAPPEIRALSITPHTPEHDSLTPPEIRALAITPPTPDEKVESKVFPPIDLEIQNCVLSSASERAMLTELLPSWFQDLSLIPLDFDPTKEKVLSLLVEIHRRAHCLRSLPPLSLWRFSWKRVWLKSTNDFVPYFEQAMNVNTDSSEFLKLILRLFELPYLALARGLATSSGKGVSKGKAALSAKLKKVESLTLQNRLHEASKILFSHGIATPTLDLATQLQDLHPPLKEPIPDLPIRVPQFNISPQSVFDGLFKKCRENWKSLDPYGWNTSLLHLIRDVARPPHVSFFTLFCNVLSQIVTGDVSDLVAFSLCAGSMIGLNKDDEETQDERLKRGLKARVRPINQGSLLLKLSFDIALRSHDGKEAAKKLLPVQQGIGAKRGMEMIAHVASSCFSKGFAILKLDASNGFQEIKRSKLHTSMQQRCPSLLKMFQKYYTKESMCFFEFNGDVKIIRATEGARIGCKMSSFGFALTVHDLYEDLRTYLQGLGDGSCVKAATDDVVIMIKTIAGEEKQLFDRVNEICKIIAMGAEKVGLTFFNDKAQLLLPKDWRMPTVADVIPSGILMRSNTLDDVSFRGMEIVGTPVGSIDFCKWYVKRNLATMVRESKTLSNLHPQCAVKLLRECVCAAPGYIAQVCHPNLTKELFVDFDDNVWELFLQIIGVNGDQLKCCNEGLSRARLRTFLPSRFHGVGLRSWERMSDYAWFSSVACCIGLEDPDFETSRSYLAEQASDAYTFTLDALGGPSYLKNATTELIPVGEPMVLCESTFYKNLFEDAPKLKLQHEFTELVCEKEYKRFLKHGLNHCHVTQSEKILLKSLKLEGYSILPSLFTASLAQYDARLTKTEFTVAARQFVWLPPLKNPICGSVELKCGCEVQMCRNSSCGSDSKLDVAGNHGRVCHPGVKQQKASILEKTLDKMFRVAGGSPTRQPATYELLGGYFSKEDLSGLFCGNLSVAASDARRTLALKYLEIIFEYPRGAIQVAQLGMLREKFPPPTLVGEEDNHGVVRLDMKLPTSQPLGCPIEFWLDHAIVHETSSSYEAETLRFLENKNHKPSDGPAFQKMTGLKKRKYATLMTVADVLSQKHKLDFKPLFLFPVISSLGFMNKDFVSLQKVFTDQYKVMLDSAPPRTDGVSVGHLRGRFKTELRNALCFALVKGNVLATYNQGLGCVRKPP
jgi:hypothetical protein